MASPSSVLTNAGANLVGKLLVAALGFVLSPYFFRWLGAEAYGLMGFYTSLSNVLLVFDLGLATVIAREVARLSSRSDEGDAQQLRDLLRTSAGSYALLGVVLGGACCAAAPWMASRGVVTEKLSQGVVVQALGLMALSLVLGWVQSAYSTFLGALQRQVRLNAIQILTSLLRSGLLVVVLLWVSRDVRAYLGVQLLVGATTLLLLAQSCRSAVAPRGEQGAFRLSVLQGHGSFAVDSALISLGGVVLTQLDRLMVTKALPLSDVGYYTLATTLGQMMYFFIHPIYSAYLPRLTQVKAQGDEQALRTTYQEATQLLAVIAGAPAAVLALFSSELLLAWTHDPQVAQRMGLTTTLLVIGALVHGVMHVPYALMVAYKWTAPGVWLNLSMLAVMLPTEWLLVNRWGTVGAAAGVLANHLVGFVVLGTAVHGKLLPGELRVWLSRGLRPAFVAVAVASVAKLLVPVSESRAAAVLELGAIGLLVLAASLASAPLLRRRLLSRLRAQPLVG